MVLLRFATVDWRFEGRWESFERIWGSEMINEGIKREWMRA